MRRLEAVHTNWCSYRILRAKRRGKGTPQARGVFQFAFFGRDYARHVILEETLRARSSSCYLRTRCQVRRSDAVLTLVFATYFDGMEGEAK